MTAPLPAESRLLRSSLAYGARGWKIVPLFAAPGGKCQCPFGTECRSPGKHPRTINGFMDESAAADTIRGWWEKWPNANIGFRPGSHGFVVVDVDGPKGETAAQALGLLAEPTLEVVSGREDGGRHRYYLHPGGTITNASVLGDGLDVRADNGYVILPPSQHHTGRVYAWRGRVEDIIPPPPAALARLKSSTTTNGKRTFTPDQLPAWMIPWLEVEEGTRNNTMTRFVGWAYGQGHDTPTVLTMALGLNTSWKDPLEVREVRAIAQSIGAIDTRKGARVTPTGRVLTVRESPATPAEPEMPLPLDMTIEQTEAAVAFGRLDLSEAPRWQWPDLHELVGPLLPGNLVIVGGLTGNGKTSFLLSQMDHFASKGVPVLYLPLEVDPETVRRRWAAWALGYDFARISRNDWGHLPLDAQGQHEAKIREQGHLPVHFPPDTSVTIEKLEKWMQWGIDNFGAKVVFIDHIHRMDFGGPTAAYRVAITDAVRRLKDLGRRHKVAIVPAAQLNQSAHPLDRYYPPILQRLKESAGIGEEADCVLMVSRRLREQMDQEVLKLICSGHREVRDYEDPNTMVVTCRKHRLIDDARDRGVLLHVQDGRVLSRHYGTQP